MSSSCGVLQMVPHPQKTQVCAFHLWNKQSKHSLRVKWLETLLPIISHTRHTFSSHWIASTTLNNAVCIQKWRYTFPDNINFPRFRAIHKRGRFFTLHVQVLLSKNCFITAEQCSCVTKRDFVPRKVSRFSPVKLKCYRKNFFQKKLID